MANTKITSDNLDTNIDIAGTLDVTGATTLDSTLDVAGVVQATGYLAVEGTSGNTGSAGDRWIGGDGTAGTWFYNVPTGSSHLFGINNSNQFVITDSGVGIGTSSPESKLAVKGSSGSADLFSISDVTVPTSGAEYGTAMIKTNSTEYALNITSYNANGKGLRIYNNGGQNAFLISQAGGDRFVVDGSGNVGIGTTSPTNVLDLGAATLGRGLTFTNYTNLFSEYSNASLWLSSNFYGNAGASGYKTSATGNYGAAGIRIHGTGGASTSGQIEFYVDANSSKTADAAFTPTKRMHILSDGEVVQGNSMADTYSPLVNGITADAVVLSRHATSGSLGMWRTNTMEWKVYHNGQGYIMTWGSNGVISGDFNDTSDLNLKENVSTIEDGTTVIKALRPVKFDWKASEKGNNQHGFIAQEVETVLPDAVEGNDYVENKTGLPEDEPAQNGKTMNSNAVLAHAVKAIQELEARIEALES